MSAVERGLTLTPNYENSGVSAMEWLSLVESALPFSEQCFATGHSSESKPERPIRQSSLISRPRWPLYANYKHYHVQLYGPQFRDFHLMFDEFADGVFDTIDDLAERLRRLGVIANTQLREFQQAASVPSATGEETVEEMMDEAHANLIRLIPPMRTAVTTADNAGDPGTVDLLSKIVQVHEKNEWFLR